MGFSSLNCPFMMSNQKEDKKRNLRFFHSGDKKVIIEEDPSNKALKIPTKDMKAN